MKITIWTLTHDTDDGTRTQVFTDQATAEAARDTALKGDFEKWISEAPYPGAEVASEALRDCVGYMDCHLLEEHEVEILCHPNASIPELMQELHDTDCQHAPHDGRCELCGHAGGANG